jgi:L-alanine-DL-glutamate epimerase-like enolase superfamily enzyme
MNAAMKITAIEAEVRRAPFAGEVRPAWAPGRIWRETVSTVYFVHTAAGLTGIGAGHGSPAFVHEVVAPRLMGEDPLAVGRLVRVLRNAGPPWASLPVACGVEMALWDLVGKAAGLPLYKLWGAHTDRVRAYASLVEVRSPERRAEDALRLLEAGYRAVKLRLHSPTLEEDIAQVEAVRRVVGDRMEIMVDANQAQEPGTPGSELSLVWDFPRALATCRALAPLGVVWLEEPLGRYAFDALRHLAAASDIPIAGGENNVGAHEFRLLIDQECYDVVQPEATVSGGLSMLRTIAGYAEMRGKLCVPHHGANGVGLAAHLQLSAASPNSPYVELVQEPPELTATAFQGLITTPLLPDDNGDVRLPDQPGLGVELRHDLERIG